MKKNLFIAIVLSAMSMQTYAPSGIANKELLKKADATLQFAARQYKHMMQHVPDSMLPRTTNAKDGSLLTSNTSWWTSGFYPGTHWHLFEYTKDPAFKAEALKRMALVEKEKNNKGTHDLGFMMYCPFGNAYRITKDPAYKAVLLTSAKSLSTRFNPTVGCIKSWDHDTWKFPVIIDNMMNLELLTWATKVSGDKQFEHIATGELDRQKSIWRQWVETESCY